MTLYVDVLVHIDFCPILVRSIWDDLFDRRLWQDRASQYGMGSGLSSKIMMIIISLINKVL